MPSSNNPGKSEKILKSLKGLRSHLQPGEEALVAIPAIWDSGQGPRSMPCDVILTNQRLMGYVFVTFPRERLFLEALSLNAITLVSLRHKSFEPIFRELLVSDSQHKVYIRAPRQKIETLYEELRSAIEKYVPAAKPVANDEQASDDDHSTPVYGRQEIHTSFESSPLAVTLLFSGGLLLEVVGVVLWTIIHSLQAGLPLFIAGLVAVLTAFVVRRQRSASR